MRMSTDVAVGLIALGVTAHTPVRLSARGAAGGTQPLAGTWIMAGLERGQPLARVGVRSAP